MSPETHLERAAEARSYTDRLRADLASLADALGRYPASRGLDALREQGRLIQGELETISARLASLGRSADPGKYCLSETEHDILADASDHRELMMEALHVCQRMRRQ
jgi:hypothetical protein